MNDVFNEFANYINCGNLEKAKELYKNYPGINISTYNEYAFRYACEKGHLKIAKWLLDIKPNINISAGDEYAFRRVCENGYLEVAKWLLEIKPDININVEDNWAFKYSSIIIKKWLSHYISYYYTSNFRTIANICKYSGLFDLI